MERDSISRCRPGVGQTGGMSDQELTEALRQTLADHRVTRGERKALRALLDEAALDDHRRALLRSQAFEIARAEIDAPQAREVLEWLNDIVGLLLAPARGAGRVRGARVPSEAWFSPGEEPLACIVRHLRAVRSRADICVFTVTDDRISDGVLSAARRGVKVRLISDDDKSGDLGSDVQRFERAGVPVALDRCPAHMHHKFALFDRARLLTGSFNWTRSASGHNHENLLVTGEPSLVAAYEAEFERLWVGYS